MNKISGLKDSAGDDEQLFNLNSPNKKYPKASEIKQVIKVVK